MKTHFQNNKFAYAIVVALTSILSVIVLLLNTHGSDGLQNNTLSGSSKVEESTAANYNTSNEEEETPHFNLFNIINKFIPN